MGLGFHANPFPTHTWSAKTLVGFVWPWAAPTAVHGGGGSHRKQGRLPHPATEPGLVVKDLLVLGYRMFRVLGSSWRLLELSNLDFFLRVYCTKIRKIKSGRGMASWCLGAASSAPLASC